MHLPTSPRSVPELERAILRALCADALPAPARDSAKHSLENYQWQDPEHRVVYEALLEAPRSGPLSLREQLPARATRLGFPDVEWQNYFGRAESEQGDIEGLVRELKIALAERL
jgi:hypothetical protein